jgi:ribosomal protein S18 acetylase RimI-like enzyme
MADLTFDPAVANTDGFLQTVRLHVDGKVIASARWHVLPGTPDGVAQIVEFHVLPPYQRRGHGKRLMTALIEQVRAYHQIRKIPLRRLWIGLRHKSHVVARAFFASQGFTHVGTAKDLLLDEELLIYLRAFN